MKTISEFRKCFPLFFKQARVSTSDSEDYDVKYHVKNGGLIVKRRSLEWFDNTRARLKRDRTAYKAYRPFTDEYGSHLDFVGSYPNLEQAQKALS